MIDEKTLARLEHHATSNNRHDYAEAFRLDRRYLALRENEIAIFQSVDNEHDADAYRAEYDAAADRLLKGGK